MSDLDPKLTHDTPHDRLTGITNAMLETLATHPDYRQGDTGIVLLDNAVERMGGGGTHGFKDDIEGARRMLEHTRAFHEALGLRLMTKIERIES